MEGTKDRPARCKCLNALDLKIIAMALMLCDHVQSFILLGEGTSWLNWIGRLAFPIFAFQIVEGFFHTHSFKKYWLRMFCFAVISEIPFNLAEGGGLLFPSHQNVMFTFCIALPLLALLEKARRKGTWAFALTAAGCVVAGYFAGFLFMVDYYGFGVLMVLMFYFLHGVRFGWIGEIAGMLLVNLGMCGSMSFQWFEIALMSYAQSAETWLGLGNWMFMVPLFGPGMEWELTVQGFAVLALVLIWMYNGKQGSHNRAIQRVGYVFYPAHLLILGLLEKLL